MLSSKFVFKQTLKHVLKNSISFSQVNIKNVRCYSRPVKMFRVLTILSKFGVQVGDKILITFVCKGDG
jgi:hypothetical protein